MKRIVLFLILFFILILFPAKAAIGSKGLIIEGGCQSITMEKGQREYLNICDGLTELPLFKGISYYSNNTFVATVGLHSGILRANNAGKATISAISKHGDAGQITVYVTKSKSSPLLLLILSVAIITACVISISIKRK